MLPLVVFGIFLTKDFNQVKVLGDNITWRVKEQKLSSSFPTNSFYPTNINLTG
jgi:hypothetical protein